MEEKKKIVELRGRLDRTLASPDLVNKNSIRSLVKSQLLRSGLEGLIVMKSSFVVIYTLLIKHFNGMRLGCMVELARCVVSGRSDTSNLGFFSYNCTFQTSCQVLVKKGEKKSIVR